MRWIFTLLMLIWSPSLRAAPITPNFSSGTLQSRTESKSTIVEVINSYDYRTGFETTTGGVNIAPANGNVFPSATTQSAMTIGGNSTNWTAIDPASFGEFNVVNEGASFSAFRTLQQPGLQNHTLIERTTTIESVTDSTSTFSQ